MRIVVVGGVAGGMSCAARARRLAEDAEIIVLERGEYVSYANCGLPYYVGGEITDRDALLLHTPKTLARILDLDVRTEHEAIGIDPAARTVQVRTPDGEETITYDELVLAPGAKTFIPSIPGIDDPRVHALRTVPDADALQELVGDARSAVVIGAGFIGLETVEALTNRGIAVRIVELSDHILPPLDADLAHYLRAELVNRGVEVHEGTEVKAIHPKDDCVLVEVDDGQRYPADLVVVSTGVTPDGALAADAGLELGVRGSIRVDSTGRTSDEHIWAVGDVVEQVFAVTGEPQPVPLAGLANRDGRRVADAIFGRAVERRPVLSTAIVRVFGMTAAATGPTQAHLKAAGIDYFAVKLHPGHHAGYYSGARPLHLTVNFGTDGRVLSAQAVGAEGVDKRIDVLATAIRAGMDADDIAELELAYAPPFGSAKDPVNMAGMIAQNALGGLLPLWQAEEYDPAADVLWLDCRSTREFARGHVPGSINIPHTQIRDRLDELREAAAGRPIKTYCATGFRGYLVTRILTQQGEDVAHLSGGLETFVAARPDVELES